MTLRLFVKLVIRLLAVGILLLSLPLEIYMSAMSVLNVLRGNELIEGYPEGAGLIVIIIMEVVIAGFVWVHAGRLAEFTLPAASDDGSAEVYATWQKWGLVFIGGWLLLKACEGGATIVSGNLVFIGDPHLCLFNLIAAIILIFDGRTILVGISRLFRTNWLRVVLAQKRNRLDRQDN